MGCALNDETIIKDVDVLWAKYNGQSSFAIWIVYMPDMSDHQSVGSDIIPLLSKEKDGAHAQNAVYLFSSIIIIIIIG